MNRPLLILLAILVAALWLVAQPEPLGSLHCLNDTPPLWIEVEAHLEGKKTEKKIPVWVCLEDYQDMNQQ